MARPKKPKIPTCPTGKATYPTRGAADRALAGIIATEKQAAVPASKHPLRSYRCTLCPGFHLTSQPPSFGSRKKRPDADR